MRLALLILTATAISAFAEDKAPPKMAVDTPLVSTEIHTKSVAYRVELELDGTGAVTGAKVHCRNCLMDAKGTVLATGEGPSIPVDASQKDTVVDIVARAMAK